MNQAKQAVNPYLPSYEYVPDGEPHVFNGRVYVYGSHDRFGGNDFCLNDYVCWSARADDLANWRYEGTSYRSVQDPLCAEGSTAMRLFAPDVQRGGDGRYYLFYALEFCGRISVAVSESPVGPFQFYDHVHYPDGTLLGAKEGDAFQYDPGILWTIMVGYILSAVSAPFQASTPSLLPCICLPRAASSLNWQTICVPCAKPHRSFCPSRRMLRKPNLRSTRF